MCSSDLSRLQVFAADDRTGDGVIPTLAICDELHRHRNLRLYRTWVGKLPKRNAQLVAISTAGEPGGEFEATREKIRIDATDVSRKGCFTRSATDSIIMHEWAMPPKSNFTDCKLVKQANPFSGITVGSLKKKLKTPTMTLQHWKRFSCNVATRGSAAAITDTEWAKAKTTEKIPEGEPVWLGVDVGWKWDTTSMVPIWSPSIYRRLLGPAKILVPPRDGTSLETAKVEQAILDIHYRNPIEVVVMDTSPAEQLAEWIRNEICADERSEEHTS